MPTVRDECIENIERIINIDVYSSNYIKNCRYVILKSTELIDYGYVFDENLYNYPKINESRNINLINHLNCQFAIYKNCYVNGNGEFANLTHHIMPPFATGPEWIRDFGPGGKIAEILPYVCVFGHKMSVNFGHFILDYLTPLMLVPESDKHYFYLVLPKIEKFAKEFLHALGFTPSKIIVIKGNQWVFANRLLVAHHPRPHLIHFGPPVKLLSKKLKNFYNLDKIPATKYVLMNREGSRKIKNFDELVDAVKAKYNDIDWDVCVDKSESIEKVSKIWASIKMICTGPGSNCYKGVFMKEKSIAVLFLFSPYDFATQLFLGSNEINVAMSFNPDYVFVAEPTDIDIDASIKAVDAAVFLSKTGKWPKPNPNEAFIDYQE